MYSGISLKFTVGEANKAALDSLESIWEISRPTFRYVPIATSSKPCGRLQDQAIGIGKEFSFKKSLHFFPPPGMSFSAFDMSPIPVMTG
eukprot:1302932-Ditylum_brightwellii.AAC.1